MTVEEIINAIYNQDQSIPQEIRKDLNDALKMNRPEQPARVKDTIVFYAFPGGNAEWKRQRQLWFLKKKKENEFIVSFYYFPVNGSQCSKRVKQYDFPFNETTVFCDLWNQISAFRQQYDRWKNSDHFELNTLPQ